MKMQNTVAIEKPLFVSQNTSVNRKKKHQHQLLQQHSSHSSPESKKVSVKQPRQKRTSKKQHVDQQVQQSSVQQQQLAHLQDEERRRHEGQLQLQLEAQAQAQAQSQAVNDHNQQQIQHQHSQSLPPPPPPPPPQSTDAKKRRGRPKKLILDPETNTYIDSSHPNFKQLNKVLKESNASVSLLGDDSKNGNAKNGKSRNAANDVFSASICKLYEQPTYLRTLEDDAVKQLLQRKDKRGRPRKFPVEQTGITIKGIRVNGSLKHRVKKPAAS